MAEKRVIELEIQDNSKSLKSQYRDAVEELQKVSAQYGETSTQAIKAAQAAAELKDQMEFSKDLIKGFNPDAKFDSLGRSIGGVLDGFQAFEGALGLVGVESEELQKTMLKVQSAMALSQGIQGLMEARDSFKQLGAVASNALKGIKSGIAATGIGLLLVALGTIVAYWDDIKAAVSGVTAEQEKLNKKSEKNAAISKEIYDSLQLQENSLKLQGKTEKQILELRVQKINAAIKDEQIRIQGLEATSKMEIAAQERNMKWVKLYVRAVLEGMAFVFRALALPIDKVIETANFVSKALGNGELVATNLNEYISKAVDKASEWTAKLLFDPEEVKAESEKTINEAKKGLKQMESDRDGFLLAIKENNKKERDDNKINSDNAIDIQKEQNDKLREYYDALEQERQGQITDAKEKELQEIDNKYEQLYAKADAANQSDKELIAKHQEEVTALNEKYAKQEAEALLKAKDEANKLRIQQEAEFQAQIEQIDEANFQAGLQKTMTEDAYQLELVRQKYFALEEAAKGNAEQLAIIETAKALEIEAIDKKSKEKQILSENELRQKRLQLTGQAFTAIGDIIGSFTAKNDKDARKQFEIQKAFNLAAAVTNTAMAVTGALTAGGNPIKLATGMQFVEAGIAAATGAASIVKIASSKFGGGGGGGNSAPSPASGGSVMSPNFSVIGSSGVNQLAQLQQKPTRAYVVSGDVANGLSLERNRLQNATL